MGIHVHMIVGNHTAYYKNTNKVNTPSLLLDSFDNITIYDEVTDVEIDGGKFTLLPWINQDNEDKVKAHLNNTDSDIVCGHLELNEYISDKKVGFIFDEKTAEKINTKDIIENYEHRKKYAELNYNKWIQNKEKIIPLLKEETKTIKKMHFFPLFLIDDIKFLIKKIFNINFYYYH